jgi:murein DD-endopeptidase MepM/ murein hydrolase activator NlpD
VDGGFGAATAAAVARLERRAGLAVDGVAGHAALRALRGHARPAARPADPVRFLRPVAGPLGDGFGRRGSRPHQGIDFLAPPGAPVGAAGRGVVVFAGYERGGYGSLVVVRHRLGFSSWYAHLARIAAWRGEPVVGGTPTTGSVVGGTPIGTAGSTGRADGAHLHFEVRRRGRPIDPLPRAAELSR